MGLALKLLLIVFMINTMLLLGGYQVLNDKTNILGSVIDLSSLNSTTNTVQINETGLKSTIQSSGLTSGTTTIFSTLFTPLILIMDFLKLLLNFIFAPLALFNIANMPFVFKLVIGGGLMVAEIAAVVSIITGRDI
jgi:hypothetical protein